MVNINGAVISAGRGYDPETGVEGSGQTQRTWESYKTTKSCRRCATFIILGMVTMQHQ